MTLSLDERLFLLERKITDLTRRIELQEVSPPVEKARVILFRGSGKYYTEEAWEVPTGAIGPYDMKNSKDFRRIGNGKVLVVTQEPWGYPHLI